MAGLFDQATVDYFGSKHSPLGLVLFWLGLPTLIGGAFYYLAVDEVSRTGSGITALWGAIALALGLPMRRKKPSAMHYRIALAWAIFPIALTMLSLFAKWIS